MSEVMVLGTTTVSTGWTPSANFTSRAPEVSHPVSPHMPQRAASNSPARTAPHPNAFGNASLLAPSYWRDAPKQQDGRQGSAWLTAEDVAKLLLRGEFLDMGVTVPSRFAPQAVASAESSVRRWTEEGRIFAIHDLFPRYQFDERGRPFPAIERAIQVFGKNDPLRVGNWFSARNGHLDGHRPQELLETQSADVVRALSHVHAVRQTSNA